MEIYQGGRQADFWNSLSPCGISTPSEKTEKEQLLLTLPISEGLVNIHHLFFSSALLVHSTVNSFRLFIKGLLCAAH